MFAHREFNNEKGGRIENDLACETPASINVSAITQTSASINFTATGNSFIVEYGTPGFAPGIGATPGAGTIVTGTASPIVLSLAEGTVYDVYVRQECVGAEYSNNSAVVQFTTVSSAVNTPYFENFDGVAAPVVPVAISVQNTNGGKTWRTVGTDYYVSAPNCIRLDYEENGVTASNDWFFTRGLNLVGGSSYRLTFQYRNSDNILWTEKLEVKYGTTPSAAGMTSGTLFSNTNIDYQLWREGGIDFTPAASGVYYIGFHGFSEANKAFVAIDDIKVDGTPACPPPIGVFINNITASTAAVNFTGTGAGYIVEYGLQGFTPGTGAAAGVGGTIINTTSSPVALSGLTTMAEYDVYVRQICVGPVYGPNSAVTPFQTTLVNDNAPGAIMVTLGAGCSGEPYTNTGATQSATEPYGSCSGATGYATVWYKFVAPASGAVRISTANGSGTNTLLNSRVALFSATDVNNYATFSIVSCDEDGGAGAFDKMSVLYATGLTPDIVYYIQVDAFENVSQGGTFCLTVDELNASMLATSASCAQGQTPYGDVGSYNGWVSLVDNESKLIALVRNSGGASVSSYSISQNIAADSRSVSSPIQRHYLNRNYWISNGTVSNIDIRFFFLNSELTSLQAVDPAVTLANLGITRQTELGCEANFPVGAGAANYLLQAGNGTSTDGQVRWVQVSTQGGANFYLHTSKAPVALKAFLQGAYSAADSRHKNVTTSWANILNANALNQPYTMTPFSYNGTENVSAGFFTSTTATTDILDWVLLELRDATNPATVITRRAAFVREDGTIVDIDGVSTVSFRGVASGNYHVTIRHRNHLGIRTSVLQAVDGSLGNSSAPVLYDFTTAQSKAFDNPVVTTNDAMAQNGSVFLMWAGNANGDDFVRAVAQAFPFIASDPTYILNNILNNIPNGNFVGYSRGDVNLDGNTRVVPQAFPFIQSESSFILNTVLVGALNGTRREHK